jgi:hypothetical protein
MYQLRKKNLTDIVAIYGRGRELFKPPTYIENTCFLVSGLSFKPWVTESFTYSYFDNAVLCDLMAPFHTRFPDLVKSGCGIEK